jgi:hypothetical protein
MMHIMAFFIAQKGEKVMITSIQANSANGVGHLACDTEADLPNLPDYAKSNNLKQGTDCIVIDTSNVYMMKSDYTFKQI